MGGQQCPDKRWKEHDGLRAERNEWLGEGKPMDEGLLLLALPGLKEGGNEGPWLQHHFCLRVDVELKCTKSGR